MQRLLQNRLVKSATIAAAMLLLVTPIGAQQPKIDPKAAELLKASTEFLAKQNRFALDTTSTLEVVLEGGQRLEFEHAASVTVQRPDKLRAERKGDLVRQVLYVDGKSIVLHDVDGGFYATYPAPGTIEQALDVARTTLDLVAPASDLLYSDAHRVLMEDVTSAMVVGRSVIDGVRCQHLAFRSPQADWQIWIEEGKRPLPRKLVITSRDVTGEPQYTVRMSRWNLAPHVTASTFEFRPPAKARGVEFIVAAPAATRK